MDWSPDDLNAAIAAGEGRGVEFKRGLPRPAKVARTLAAFANTRGGLLLIGIGDRGERVGAPRPRETVRALREIAATRVEPPLAIEVQLVHLDEAAIVACSVPLSAARPHAAIRDDGRSEVVVRSGSSNRAADGATARALAGPRRGGGSNELEKRILEWIRHETRGRGPSEDGATVAAFCAAQNVGRQRGRRAFLDLERAGLLVGHGLGSRRRYHRA
jgi:hypothetical protein